MEIKNHQGITVFCLGSGYPGESRDFYNPASPPGRKSLPSKVQKAKNKIIFCVRKKNRWSRQHTKYRLLLMDIEGEKKENRIDYR